MLGIGKAGWIEKDRPECGPLDAICKPLAIAISSHLIAYLFSVIAIGKNLEVMNDRLVLSPVPKGGDLFKSRITCQCLLAL